MRPHLAGASGTTLDLVIDQQQAVLVTQFAKAAQALFGQSPYAAFALHDLQDHRRGGVVHRR